MARVLFGVAKRGRLRQSGMTRHTEAETCIPRQDKAIRGRTRQSEAGQGNPRQDHAHIEAGPCIPEATFKTYRSLARVRQLVLV